MKAVVLAGGKGRRLAPYTAVLPKPLMPIGDIPILEVVIKQLKHAGFNDITMAVGYLAELIKAYFGDGEKWEVKIGYSREQQPLGTAGPLSLITGLDTPFLVMNGDLLTTLDYKAMWNYHLTQDTIATLATFRRKVKIDLGVIETDEHNYVKDYVEKPTYDYKVSTGIYVFSPSILHYIPSGRRLDLPELILKVIKDGQKVATFPFEGRWLDIGRPDDYQEAVQQFQIYRSEFILEA